MYVCKSKWRLKQNMEKVIGKCKKSDDDAFRMQH